MPGIDFAGLRARIPIEDVLRLLGFDALHGQGDWVRGRCPFQCSDDTRAFAVNLATNRYYCHCCDQRGNQLELWCELHGLPLFEGAKDVCEQLHESHRQSGALSDGHRHGSAPPYRDRPALERPAICRHRFGTVRPRGHGHIDELDSVGRTVGRSGNALE
jgi:hypothetical protein